jgi:hypothetical protein
MRLALAVLVFALVIPMAAGAQDSGPTDAELAEARHSFDLASSAFDDGDYETAATEFNAAYELTRAPDLLFNVYLAEERAGRLAEADAALTRYLADGTIEAEQRALLERRLERLRARIASRAPAPVEEEHVETLLASPIAPVAAPITPPAPVIDTSPPTAAIAVLVSAGVLAVSFGVFVALSEVEDQRLASTCGRDAGRSCSSSDVASLQTFNIVSDVSWIGAAVLAATGVVLLFALPPEQHERAMSRLIVPWVSASGGGIAARLTL